MNPSHTVVHTGIFDLIGSAGLVVQIVLIGLIGTSIFCWAIIWVKGRELRIAKRENKKFLAVFWKAKSLEEIYHKTETYPAAPLSRTYRAAFKELQRILPPEVGPNTSAGLEEVDSITRSLARASQQEAIEMERYLNWLATTASAAPFVGLFGTVWGIMSSFRDIGLAGSASLSVVAPGISEALIATAVGLLAAIPAVIAYNYFVNQLRQITLDLDSFSKDLVNIVHRKLVQDMKRK